MDIQVGPESSISTPSAGYRTLFVNTDKGNALYYKLPDGTFEPAILGAGDIEGIAGTWTDAVTCAMKKGIITATQFEDIMNQGIVVTTNSTTDPTTGSTTTTISVGARTIPVTSITLDSSTFTGAAAATHQITTTFAPTNATNQGLTYVTSNAAKATVSANGLITLVATGSAVITVIPADDPAKSKTVTVTIT